ncbi:phosphatase PAP2 family protein [Clostridium sp. 19966]|uniref:phosphatase PAP2 family protein n=1 Tax=Clostridium sp. 19966 TaxID=2768166 RepID=UPI0028DD69B2|nr:phosphatase PAP2 family protein [Clostridium sp. 19966]MDT8716495.1 phosphatase PAP2 family protein [Clostridium sp. 19966]
MMEFLQVIDIRALEYIDKHFKNPILDRIMPVVTSLGNFGVIWIAVSLMLLENKSYRFEGIMLMSSLLLTTIMGEGIIKHIVKRSRPFTEIVDEKLLIARPVTYSFPSGHSASSFAAASIFVNMNNWISSIAVMIAILIAFSRLYLKVHYPLDVFSGILLGILCSSIVMIAF